MLAVRPESIGIGGIPGVNDATVDIVEPQGAYTILVATVLGGEWKIMLNGDPGVRPGDVVSLGVDTARVMLFDSDTRLRLD